LFQIVPVSGLSDFSNLKIVSDLERPTPLFPIHRTNTLPRPTANNTQPSLALTQSTPNSTDQSIHPQSEEFGLRSKAIDSSYLTVSTKATTQPFEDAKALTFGLLYRYPKGAIKPQTTLWIEAQNTLCCCTEV
jgi:hypothetical protein